VRQYPNYRRACPQARGAKPFAIAARPAARRRSATFLPAALASRLGTLGYGTLLLKIRIEPHPVAEFRIGERPQIEDDPVHQP
jgi:hypothetical protein